MTDQNAAITGGGCRNRAPLQQTPFVLLPLGSVRPQGWLRDQLRLQADGITGHLHDFWPDVGPNSGWLGGAGEDWERGPYYLDGLLPLAHQMEDQRLLDIVGRFVEWTLASQREDGFFGPANMDWWPRMVMLKVLCQHFEATQDERVPPFLTRYFRHQLTHLPQRPLVDWGEARGAENVLTVLWLYNRTGDAFLLDLARILVQQTLDWTGMFTDFPYRDRQTTFNHRTHVVNVAMGLKAPALFWVLTGDPRHRSASAAGIEHLMRYHGQAQGMFAGDEWLAGLHPSRGVELCAVVEYMFSLEHLMCILGDAVFGDILEKVSYNALPAAITADMWAHQFDQQPNQVLCTLAKRDWTANNEEANLFGLEPNFGCCTANLHQGWPKLAASLWMASDDDGLAAVAYAPCEVHATVRGSRIRIVEETNYPFGEVVRLHIHCGGSVEFPLRLRIPSWCKDAKLRVRPHGQGGENATWEHLGSFEAGRFYRIERVWNDGDEVELLLPMVTEVVPRPNHAVAIERGPLVFALEIGERWHRLRGDDPCPDWEVYPTTPWNYGLVVEPGTDPFKVVHGQVGSVPFSGRNAPVRLIGSGRRIPEWGLEGNWADEPPESPVATAEPIESIQLIPYGCARLRISEFPVTKE